MTSLMGSPLMFVLILVTECYSSRYAGGFNVGGSGRLDLSAGGQAVLKKEGSAFTGDANGFLGAKLQGKAVGTAYGVIDDEYYGVFGSARGSLERSVNPGLHGKFRPDSKDVPMDFQPSIRVYKETKGSAKGQILTGDDAKKLEMFTGDFEE